MNATYPNILIIIYNHTKNERLVNGNTLNIRLIPISQYCGKHTPHTFKGCFAN